MKDQTRNIHPTAPALAAMALWGDRYAVQRGGSMDFWDSLSVYHKRTCTELAKQIKQAPLTETQSVTSNE